MPNWCYNTFTIKGSENDIKQFVDAITVPDTEDVQQGYKRSPYDFTRLHPCPEELKITAILATTDDEKAQELNILYEANRQKYGYAHWYDWAWANWSTKWRPDIQDFAVSYDGDNSTIEGAYETAWSPCDNLWVHISAKFPNLRILTSYDEESNAFLGASAFTNGVLYEVGTDFSRASLTELSTELAEQWLAVEGELGDIDGNDEQYDALMEHRNDISNDIRDLCERSAAELMENA